MRSLVWAFVASFAIHTLIFSAGLRYAFYIPVGGYHRARVAMEAPDDQFGIDHSTGDAINMSPGLEPLVAPQSDQTQAWLNRDSASAVNVNHVAARPVTDPGEGGGGGFGSPSPQAQQTPKVQQQPPMTKAQQPTQKPDQQTQVAKVEQQPPPPQVQNDQAPPTPTADAQPKPTPAIATATPQPSPAQQVTQATQGNGRPPGKPGQPGESANNPGPASDQDADPFSDKPQVSFHLVNGRVVAQDGRWVKMARPQFDETGLIDLGSVDNPSCKFAVLVDEQGNVAKAVLVQSSGYKFSVDLPTEVAIYKSTFEPSKDDSGHPIPDTIEITIYFRQ